MATRFEFPKQNPRFGLMVTRLKIPSKKTKVGEFFRKRGDDGEPRLVVADSPVKLFETAEKMNNSRLVTVVIKQVPKNIV